MKTMIDLSEPPIEAKAKSDWENPDRVKQKDTWGDEHLTLLVDIFDDDVGGDTGDNVFLSFNLYAVSFGLYVLRF